jgi:regulator of protease activity HflC (stomatin/prohibitin superfamily)
VFFLVIGAVAWLMSFKGTDSGVVCVVREGGPFDGRGITDVRRPGSGPKPIGAFNHQDCLPVTERDSNDVIPDDQTFPTKDSVQVIADGQALYQLTQDPKQIRRFYVGYGRRPWDGHDLTSQEGFLNFQRQRLAPVILDAMREVIGRYDCVQLNNLCQYVQNPDEAVRAAKPGGTTGDAVTQNLSEANRQLGQTIDRKLRAAFRGAYFENVRYQNLRIRFEPRVQDRITEAQSLRTQTANAKLDAARRVAAAKGQAEARIATAKGAREVAHAQAQAYRANPTQREIDKIEAFCGPDGCDPKVVGGSISSVIAGLDR